MRLSIEIPDETHRSLKAKAASDGVTISEIVRIAVERYLKGNFHLGYPVGIEDRTIHVPPPVMAPPRPDPPPSLVRSISKADQAKGRTRK